MDISEANLDYPVEFDRIRAAKYTATEWVNPLLIERLKQASAARVAQSEEFQKVTEKIEHYVEQKETNVVSLNEEKYLARRELFDAEKEDERTLESQINHTNAEIVRDYFLNEVIQVALDYIALREGRSLAQKDASLPKN
jgi:carboxyl-terminal processing protease